jgi:hypothetical protein
MFVGVALIGRIWDFSDDLGLMRSDGLEMEVFVPRAFKPSPPPLLFMWGLPGRSGS